MREKRTVQVEIPAGIESTSIIRVSNQGHSTGAVGKRGGGGKQRQHGHLLLKPVIQPHAIFTRQGFDIHCTQPLPLTVALLGGTTLVPTLDGNLQTIRVEKGTQNMSVQTLPGKGIKLLKNNSNAAAKHAHSDSSSTTHGSQHITWSISVPPTLSQKSKDLIKQLALELGQIQNVDLSEDVKTNSKLGAATATTAAAKEERTGNGEEKEETTQKQQTSPRSSSTSRKQSATAAASSSASASASGSSTSSSTSGTTKEKHSWKSPLPYKSTSSATSPTPPSPPPPIRTRVPLQTDATTTKPRAKKVHTNPA